MLRLLVAAPFLIVLVAFVLSNPDTVVLRLWPTDLALDAPLSLAVLGISAIFFLLGAAIVWIGGFTTRRRARRAEKRVVALEAELAARTPRPAIPALAPRRGVLIDH